jgi:hypothetical protein
VPQRDPAQPGFGAPNDAGDATARDRFTTSRPFVAGRSLPTANVVSIGAATLFAFLFALKVLPVMSYRLHLPLWVFYALLIGGAFVALLARRRWARLLPREPRLDLDHMDPSTARREAIFRLEAYAFRVLPILAALAVMIWFGVIHHNTQWFTVSVGFAIVWSVVARPIWSALVLPLLRRT